MRNKERIRGIFTITYLISFFYVIFNLDKVTAIVFPLVMVAGAILGMITQHTMFFGKGDYANAYKNHRIIGFVLDFIVMGIGIYLLIYILSRFM